MAKKGFIYAPEDERDYPICMAYDDADDIEIPDKFTTSFQPPYAKQVSGNCVAQSIANIMEVMYYNVMDKHEDFSVGFVYGNRNANEHQGEGMTGYLACNHLVKDGNVKSSVFDNIGEAPSIIKKVNEFKEQFPFWKDLAYIPTAYIRTKNAEQVKKFILKYNIPVMAIVKTKHFWWSGGLHAMALYGWDRDTAIMQNSWGEKKKPIVEVDFKNIEEFWLITPFEIEKFIDLDQTHWAFESIVKCIENRIIQGYPDNTFRPEKQMTRAEAVAVIYRMLKEREKNEKGN